MLKKLLAAFFFYTVGTVSGWEYRGDSFENLPNNINLITLNASRSNNVYMIFGFHRIEFDEFQFSGAEEVLSVIFKERLQNFLSSKQVNSYVDQDKILLSVYGKSSEILTYIEKIKKCLGIDVSSDELQRAQEKIKIKLKHDQALDKMTLRQEVQNALYNHTSEVTEDSVERLTLGGINFVKNEYYEHGHMNVIVACNEKSDLIKNALVKNFEKRDFAKQEQLEKSPNSDFKKELKKDSSQLNVPFIEMSWKVSGYRNDAKQTAKFELVLLYLNERLKDTFVNKMKVARFFEITSSLWNGECGEVKISVIPANKVSVKDLETMILCGVRALTSEELTPRQFNELKNLMIAQYDVFNFRCDVIDTANWLAERLNAGFSYAFLKGLIPLIKKLENKKVLKTSVEIFDKDPNVIAELMPEGGR